ncbi:MAG: hypothetical protein HLUCCO02_11185 [Idiomarinaceae bacterium HL-53]|nr:MAG: hypothetical protein HLUCCO02_11185 [Idiomarinaceae bacterium HL-53]CUS47635.1 hypothetical protein Ga0003345_0568 [Idiomarinaceae bacterium HL-53]
MPIHQRIGWLAAAVLSLTLPIWLDPLIAPGDRLTIWTWTESRGIAEQGISILFVFSAIAGFFLFRQGAKDWREWKTLRFGLGIWITLVILFSGYTFWIFSLTEQTETASFERDHFEVRTIQSSGTDGSFHFLTVMSCDRQLLSQRVIYLDEFVGGNGAQFSEQPDDENLLTIQYTNEGRVLNETVFDLDELYRQCMTGESPRPSPFKLN